MHLTNRQERILEGDAGQAEQLCYRILVNLGELEGADRMIPVKGAHISGVSYKTGGEGLIRVLERFQGLGARTSVQATLNPAGMDLTDWVTMGVPEDFAEKQKTILRLYTAIGVKPTCTCIPYQLDDWDHIRPGDHLSWAESNAVIYANSILGARTNREGSISSLASAVIGQTPEYGMHLDGPRLPTVRITVKGDLSPFDLDILGAHIGLEHNSEVPFIEGIRGSDTGAIKHMGAAMAAKGGIPLYHVFGITPEHESIDRAEKEGLISDRIELEVSELRSMADEIFPPLDGDIDIFAVGCPHLGPDELRRLAELVKGKRKREGKRFMAFTARSVLDVVEKGTLRSIRGSGVELYADTCMVVMPLEDMGPTGAASDSGKAAHYIPKISRVPTSLMPLEKMVEAAFSP